MSHPDVSLPDVADLIIERLNRIARRQRGLITRAEALAAGLTDGQITARLRTGIWILLRPDVYAVAAAPPSWEQSLLAVTLAAPCLTSHQSTGFLFGLRGFDQPDRIEVVSTFEQFVRLDGVRGHRSRSLFDVDKSYRLGIPTVTAERALIDVSGALPAKQLGAVLDDAIRRKVADLESFRRCAERLTPGPGRSLRRVRDVLGERVHGYNPGDSDLETRALRALVAAGFPPPRQQFRMKLRGKNVRIDLAYPEQRIAIELDSWEFHGMGNRTAFRVDRARKNDLLVIGWAPTSFTADMSDEYFIDTIRALWPDECVHPGAA
jgi:Transcriptional regulator, AbiEi antitoxin